MEAIVGIDIGTTNIKVNAFDKKGKPLYSTHRYNRVLEEGKNYDLDGKYILNQVLDMLKELVDQDFRILSLGVSSMAESVFPVSNSEDLEEHTMIWYDKRSEDQQQQFHKKFSRSDFYNITGLNSEYLFSIFKLLWYYQNRPQLFKSADKWLPVNSYLCYKLTGEKAMEYSIASRTGILDIQKRDWSREILKHLSFTSEVFPKLKESGSKLGILKKEYQDYLGINYEIPVSLGGHDHICGSFAVAAFQGRVILDSMGTSENILGIVDLQQLNIEDLYQKRLNFGAHVVPGRVYVYQAFNYSSAIINNLISLFFDKPMAQLSDEDFQKFNKEARRFRNEDSQIRLSVEQNGDKFFKDSGCLKDLSILNIPFNGERGEIFMAALRYLCFKSKQIIKNLEDIMSSTTADRSHAEVIAIGGSTKNELWMEEKSKILPQPLYINGIEKAVTLGAALLGGIGAGLYSNYQEAVQSISRSKKRV